MSETIPRAGGQARLPRTLGAVAVLICILAGACARPPDIAGVPDDINYNWHVRPILSENCFACHGPDSEGREASLRLDSPEFAFNRLEGPRERYAIMPGDLDRSELVWRIEAPNAEDLMPPVQTHKTLTERDKAILRQWIADGAEYQRHWAFLTPEVEPAPPSAFDDRAANEIDRYVFARLASEGVQPSPEADRETLINRVSLTLTGLPPSLDEVDAFVADAEPGAYGKLVGRLLESPRYAEHMAAWWLDLARWSDTDGYLDDHHDRYLWPWRDWVTASIADELCFIKSLHTEHVNHDPASKFLHTGFQLAGRPSAGAWISYALGSDNRDLPNFVVMNSGSGMGVPQDSAIWGTGFLPSNHQGVEFRAAEDPVLYINNPDGIESADRRAMLDAIADIARLQHEVSNDPEVFSRVSQYEMAYRMQRSVPEIADISDEPEHVLDLYGPDVHTPGSFARNCLIARRLCERGVKYQTLFALGWDHHLTIRANLPLRCREIDQPAAALVTDLRQRGLLDDTLVLFGSEFGRTPFAQGQIDTPLAGRDHHGGGFTWWLAGGGVKAGLTFGETDEFAYNVVENPVHIHDLNATLLHILGIDHERLNFRFQGRDYRLTDVHGRVVREILA